MIFEKALAELRKGKKIRHPHFDENVYLIGCYVGPNLALFPNLKESFEDMKARGISITWMRDDKLHSSMMPKFIPECSSKLHASPQLNLLLIMSDEWESIS